MSLHLLDSMTEARGRQLVGELSFDALLGLLFEKARVEGKRVTVRVRPAEARVRVEGRRHG